MRRGQCLVRYEAGDWDECERLAAAVPALGPALAVVELALQRCWWRWAAGVLQPSACATSPRRPAWIPSSIWRLPAWRPTRPPGKVTSNEPARPSSAASPSSIPASSRASPTVENAWICAIGLVVQAELAERARAAGDAETLSDAITVGHILLERAGTAVEQTADWLGAPVTCRGSMRRLSRVEPGPGSLRPQGLARPPLRRSRRMCMRWPVAGGGWPKRSLAPVTGSRRPWPPRRPTRRCSLAPNPASCAGGAGPAGPPRSWRWAATERGLAGLTPRELEVLRLLVEGRSNRQIAEQLYISGKTASVHVTNILAKLGVHSRLEAAATSPPSRPGPAGTGGLCDLTAGRPGPGLLPRTGPHHRVRPAGAPATSGQQPHRCRRS